MRLRRLSKALVCACWSVAGAVGYAELNTNGKLLWMIMNTPGAQYSPSRTVSKRKVVVAITI